MLAKEAVKNAEEVDKIFWQEGLQVDENRAIQHKTADEGDPIFLLVTDPKYTTIEDVENKIQSVYTKRGLMEFFGDSLFSGNWSRFFEQDGELYRERNGEENSLNTQLGIEIQPP